MLWLPLLLLPTFSTLFTPSTCYELCNGTFCPPTFVKSNNPESDPDEPAPILLGRDARSGCYCRELPKIYTICFGRENCRLVPKSIPIKTPLLRIKSTLITSVNPGDFDGMHHLEAMRIEINYLFEKVTPKSFYNMTNLTNLSISYNFNFKVLQKNSFDGLVNLKELYLVKNGFTNIYDVTIAFSERSLPVLQQLSLNENTFIEIGQKAFKPMMNTSLESLSLILCRIDYLHPDTFCPLKKMETLRLGENSFNASTITKVITKTIEQKIPLRQLNLYSVGFRKTLPKDLLEALAKSSIVNLNLARNQFEVITADSFPLMPNLQILDLRDVLALNISKNAFSNLPNLKTLLLSGNKLSTIPEGVLLPNLTYLDLQHNSGNLFFPSYLNIFQNKFSKMKKLQYLDLSFNHIMALYNSTFVGLDNLRILGLKNSTIYHVTNNSFAPLKNLVFLNLENNYFLRNSSNQYQIDYDIFRGLDKLKILLLAGCGISFFSRGNPLEHLKSLEHLGLERNLLLTLTPTDFSALSKLRSIDLSYNSLLPWQERIFSNNSKLEAVAINRNKIGYLSLAMLEDLENVTTLEMEDNPFTCDCSSYTTTALWLEKNPEGKLLEVIHANHPYCIFPDNFSNLTIVEYFEMVQNHTVICEAEEVPSRLWLIVPVVFFVAILVVLAFFCYYYRWHIRYWVFLTRLYLSRKGKIKGSGGKQSYTNYEYDAFVSYSNEDRNFVIRLVAMLESYEPFLKLCVYERDFQIGTVISESVLESVAKSRKTLLVISDNYAKSQWCRWESQIAEHHRLFFENEHGEYVDDTLVLIKLGPVSDSHLTPTLKYLLKTRIYLAWESDDRKQKVFWEKLRTTLAPLKNDLILENTRL